MNTALPDTLSFAFEDIVWMVTDEDDGLGSGQVIGFLFKPGSVLVQVQWGYQEMGYHYPFELTKEKPKKFA